MASVYISYRRGDTSHIVGRLYDRLENALGPENVLLDVDTISLGVDFAQVIERAIDNATVVLVVIGPQWLTTPMGTASRACCIPMTPSA